MEEQLGPTRSNKKIITMVIAVGIFLVLFILGYSLIKKKTLVSPLPDESSGVRIIFVSPIPSETASPSAELVASASASPKTSPKATVKPKASASPSSTPKASATASPTLTPTASP